MKREWKKLLAFVMALLMVVGVLPGNMAGSVVYAATDFVGGEEVASGDWAGWTWSVFGNSVSTDNNTIKDDGKGKLTLTSSGKSGKIASNQEGINYLYYELAKENDFIIKTNATVNSLDTGNNQVGFGLMLRAKVGTHGDKTDVDPLNSTTVGGIGNKNNAGSYRTGNEKTDFSYISANKDVKIAIGSTYDLCIQKVGDRLYLWMNGALVGENYNPSVSDIISEDMMYIGLFTSRDAGATYSNTVLNTVASGSAITINSDTLKAPDKTQYIKGNTYEDIDLTGFSVKGTVDGKEVTITADECRIEDFDFSEETENGTIELNYFGESISIPITVITEVVEDITVHYLPVKTEYAIGDTVIDWAGFDATVTYNSGMTKKLQDLIAEEDPETVITFDSSAAGDTKIIVTHTHGDVAKSVEIPVTISSAKVTEIAVTSGPNQTTFYKDVEVAEDAYKAGLQITATYDNGNSKILTSGFEVTPVSEALDITKVGDYAYKVSFGGQETTYTLKVVERSVTGLEIAAYPTVTTFEKGTEFSSAGLKVNAVYDSKEETELAEGAFTVDASAFDKDTVGEYTIKVSATVDGQSLETSFIAAVRDKVTFQYEDLEWNSILFGQSTSGGTKPVIVDNADGTKTITVELAGGKGKVTDDGQDGISYYYTILDPRKDNFEITAKVTVDYFITKTSPDNQEGFGIMVRDSIGSDGDSSIYYSNAMSVGGYYGRYNIFGRYGILGQDDTNGRVNYTMYGKSGNLNYQVKEDAPKTFILTLKKDNSGIYATMTDEAGEVVDKMDGTQIWYLPSNTFSAIEEEAMYLGFMAARGAKIEINSSDIQMKVTACAADAPQTFAPEKPISPSVSMQSLDETSDENYELVVKVNTKGLLTVNQNGKEIVPQKAVEAGNYTFPVALTMGENKFQLYFEPDGTQNITSDKAVVANVTVTRKIYEPESVIYASADGTADGKGTKESPLDIQTAITYCQAGQAVYLLEGTYQLSRSTGVWHGNDGTEEKNKMLMACPDNTGDVIIDFADPSNGKATGNTFDFSGDYWYVSGIKFLNGGGVRVGGNHNILENCDFAGHTNSGLSISRTNSANTIEEWPSYNQIISCNAYNNRDASDNNADGFAAKLTCGVGNVFKYCVAAYNADDGWDLFAKGSTGPIGEIEIYNSLCYANGFAYDMETGKIEKTKGDGNGFKMGGSGIPVAHAVYNSYSFGNAANGFTNNSDPLGTYVNCTGFNNGGSNLELHVYTGVTPQFTVKEFKSFADDSYQELDGLLSATESEATAVCIDSVRSTSNYFYDAKTGVSSNSRGEALTAESFYSVAGMADYINGGIASVKRTENGAIDLGDFLKYRKPSSSSDDDDDDDSSSGSSSSSSTSSSSAYENRETLNSAEAAEVSNVASQVFGSASQVQKVEKTTSGICIVSKENDVVFSKNDGTLAKNEWQLCGKDWYYFDADNKAASGWKALGGKWYYLNNTSKKMETGWLKSPISGKWYYMDGKNGDMQTGWKLVNNKWYFMDTINGDMKSDWQLINNKWYYMDAVNGDMKTGWQQIRGKWYYMDRTNGDCLMNTTTPDGYAVDADGAWIQ